MTPEYFAERAFAQGVSDSYAAIRRAGALRDDWRPPLRSWRAAWRDHRLAAGARGDPVVVQWRSVLAAVRRAHAEGVAFHREAVRADPQLLAWVLKEDYR